jgi:putative flippase GtrA
MAKNKKLRKELIRIAEYLVTGGAWFWSGYAMFFVCDQILGWSFFPAKITATLVGLTVNFILERWWVFAGKDARKDIKQVTWRYVIVTVINIVLDTLIVWGLKLAGISPYIGQFISSGFFTFWNYIWYKFYVFAKQKKVVRRQSAPVIHRNKKARPATKLSARA